MEQQQQQDTSSLVVDDSNTRLLNTSLPCNTTMNTTSTSSSRSTRTTPNDHTHTTSPTTTTSTNTTTTAIMPFHDDCLIHDPYHGVTLLLHKMDRKWHHDANLFAEALTTALEIWRTTRTTTTTTTTLHHKNNDNNNDNHNHNNNDTSTTSTSMTRLATTTVPPPKRGIWVHVPQSLHHLIPVLMGSFEFDFHQVLLPPSHEQEPSPSHEPSPSTTTTPTTTSNTNTTTTTNNTTTTSNEDVLVLKRWLPSTPSRLPFGPTHQVGVGALVLQQRDKTSKNTLTSTTTTVSTSSTTTATTTSTSTTTTSPKLLVVKEQSGPAKQYDLWKMPTGLLDPGEDVGDAAVRELKEETGLDGRLERILCVRQAHRREASDLFFVCLLTLVDESQQPVLQPEEIADCQWMSFREYASQEVWQGSPVYQEMNANIEQALHDERAGMVVETLPLGFGPGTNTLFKSNV